MPPGVALGLVPHTGWTWLVRVRGTARAPCVELRARVAACDVLEGELFHRAAALADAGERERLVADERARALRRSVDVLSTHVAGASRAVVLGKRVALPELERILGAHPLIHTAEGELWRALFTEACVRHGLEASRRVAGDVRQGRSAAAIDAFLAAGRQAVGAPWVREVQDAALAAWGALD